MSKWTKKTFTQKYENTIFEEKRPACKILFWLTIKGNCSTSSQEDQLYVKSY